jgi:NADP-dependent 3-hydroxy acid dehydrogenase YdfG
VYLVGRSATAADRIIKECGELNKDGKVEFLKADVTELKEVDRVCKEIQKREKKINLLVQTQGNLTLSGRNGERLNRDWCTLFNAVLTTPYQNLLKALTANLL